MADKRDALRERCKADLRFLVVDILGMTRWNDELHGGMVSHIEAPGDRKLVLVPRGHQKSTIISVCWVVQQLLRNPNTTVGIYSAKWGLAKDLLNHIKNILTQSALKDIFGEFRSRDGRWTLEEIDIAQKDNVTIRNASVRTGGLDGGKTGTHCSLMIFDDPVTPENTTTPEQTRKTIDSYKDCLPLLDPGGKIIVVGTRYSNGDLYGGLIENESRSINGTFFETEEERKTWRRLVRS
jgi:hypothetical protein